jgi:hypothetical protein
MIDADDVLQRLLTAPKVRLNASHVARCKPAA